MGKARIQIDKGNLCGFFFFTPFYSIFLYVHLHVCGAVHMQRSEVRGQVGIFCNRSSFLRKVFY